MLEAPDRIVSLTLDSFRLSRESVSASRYILGSSPMSDWLVYWAPLWAKGRNSALHLLQVPRGFLQPLGLLLLHFIHLSTGAPTEYEWVELSMHFAALRCTKLFVRI